VLNSAVTANGKVVRPDVSAAAAPVGHGRADLQSAYKLPTSRGVGQPVAVVAAYDNPNADQLFDVATGSNGSCGGSYLCTAGPGFDGPTGLGTPSGLGAF
jgi:hypothetical protein